MGGRGGAGGGAGGAGAGGEYAGLSKYESTVLGPKTVRVPYSKYKNEYGGAQSVRDSYDSASKTIEVKADPVTRAMMDIVPDSYARQFPSSMSKYQIAKSVHDDFTGIVASGEKKWSGMEKWQKDGYDLVKTERLLTGGTGTIRYKTVREAVNAMQPTKKKKKRNT